MHTNAKFLLHHAAAAAAHLRRIGGMYPSQLTASVCSFACEKQLEHAKPRVGGTQRQAA